MEVTIDVVQPNVFVDGRTTIYDDRVYVNILFSTYDKDVIPVSKTIDDIVSKTIGGLKVSESDYKAVQLRDFIKLPEKEKYTVPLRIYLENYRIGGSIGSIYSRVFGSIL